MATQISKKRKFVADGVFFAELNEVLTRELAEDGYSGVEVRVTPMRTEIIIRATRTQNVLGEKGRRIRELTSLVQKRFKFPENSVELYAERVNNRGLCAIAQAESLRYKLLGGLAVRRACYGVLRFVMENGAKGCEVIVSGKLRAQRAKSMKFKDGYMVSSGQPVKEYIDSAVRHVLLRQGVLGIKVKIMLDWDPTGKVGPKTPLPDNVIIHMPKDDVIALPPKEVEEYRPPIVADDPLPMPSGRDKYIIWKTQLVSPETSVTGKRSDALVNYWNHGSLSKHAVWLLTDPILEATSQNAYHFSFFQDSIWSANEDGHNIIRYGVPNPVKRIGICQQIESYIRVALQMQWELQWFKEVEGFVCPRTLSSKIPQMVFTRAQRLGN
ncbi:hypothetical protein LXL04_025403 [Taraxacum kok-saghyz]